MLVDDDREFLLVDRWLVSLRARGHLEVAKSSHQIRLQASFTIVSFLMVLPRSTNLRVTPLHWEAAIPSTIVVDYSHQRHCQRASKHSNRKPPKRSGREVLSGKQNCISYLIQIELIGDGPLELIVVLIRVDTEIKSVSHSEQTSPKLDLLSICTKHETLYCLLFCKQNLFNLNFYYKAVLSNCCRCYCLLQLDESRVDTQVDDNIT